MSSDALGPSNNQIIEHAARGELTEAQIKTLIQHDAGLAKLAIIAAVQTINPPQRHPRLWNNSRCTASRSGRSVPA